MLYSTSNCSPSGISIAPTMPLKFKLDKVPHPLVACRYWNIVVVLAFGNSVGRSRDCSDSSTAGPPHQLSQVVQNLMLSATWSPFSVSTDSFSCQYAVSLRELLATMSSFQVAVGIRLSRQSTGAFEQQIYVRSRECNNLSLQVRI